MRVACVVGARPNFVKMAPILKEFDRYPDTLDPVVVHTGQHHDAAMSAVFLDELGFPTPAYFLGVGSPGPMRQLAAIVERFDEVCDKQAFDRVLVVGDVSSTLACALVAARRNIPVDHVEAGLRSFDRTMPEEVNRVAVDALASQCFVTEQAGVVNLLREGHDARDVHLVGNTMIDTLFQHLEPALAREPWRKLGVEPDQYGLVTLHRPSNVDDAQSLAALLTHLADIATLVPVVFPVHPRTRANIDAGWSPEGMRLCGPMGYLDFLGITARARFVITDSGGVQEETTALGIPCLTIRPNTERPSTIEVGTNTLVDDPRDLVQFARSILKGAYKIGSVPELWDGNAAGRIVALLGRHAVPT